MSVLQVSMTVPAQRLCALQPYFGKLQTWNQRIPAGDSGHGATVVIGGQRFLVESWERRILSDWGGSDSEEARLVMEGLACMAKSLTDIEQLDKGSSASRDALYRCQAELLLDTAISTALLREVRRAVDASVTAGEMEQARRLTSLQHRMNRVQAQAMQRLTESNLPRVRTLADSLTEVADERPDPSPEVVDEAMRFEVEGLEGSPRAKTDPRPIANPRVSVGTRPRPSIPGPAPSPGEPFAFSTKLLAVMAVVAISSWALFVALPATLHTEPTLVTAADLPRAEEYRQVVARPPSLFVDVDRAEWDRLAQPERWTRIREISRVISPLGYEGLLIRGLENEPLGQWVEGRGIRLLGEPAIDSADQTAPPRSRP